MIIPSRTKRQTSGAPDDILEKALAVIPLRVIPEFLRETCREWV